MIYEQELITKHILAYAILQVKQFTNRICVTMLLDFDQSNLLDVIHLFPYTASPKESTQEQPLLVVKRTI